MGSVVDANATTLGCALLVVVDTHPISAADNHGGIHTVPAQRVDRRLADRVGGKSSDIDRIHSVVGQGDSHVGLSAAEGKLQVVGLDKSLVVIGL